MLQILFHFSKLLQKQVRNFIGGDTVRTFYYGSLWAKPII